MAMFNKKTMKLNSQVQTPETAADVQSLIESGYGATVNGTQMYNFVQGMRSLDSNYINNDYLLERMCQDSVVASAIDMFVEDALQLDPETKTMFSVEVDTPDDYIEDELSKGLALELTRFLKDDLRMEKEASRILKRIIKYGDAPIKLGFVDKLEDEKYTLKESAKDVFNHMALKTAELFEYETEPKLKKGFDETKNDIKVSYEDLAEDVKFKKSSSFKKLKESIEKYSNKVKLLKESEDKNKSVLEKELLDIKKEIKGRWYTEIIGHGTNIYTITAKGKVIAYADRDNPDKYINPESMVCFSNNTGKHSVLFSVGGYNEKATNKDYFRIERGESFLENSMVAWQILSAIEDILLLTRMTRSILYRIFSVEVANKGNKEARDILNNLKSKIKSDESVNVREKIYNSSLSQVPLGDSIFIPTRNGIGVIDVKTVGGDVNLRDAVDLDYFKDKMFAGLRIPKAFLNFESDLPGGLGNTSLTRMDIRYSRTVTRLQTIMAEGMKDLCLLYLKMTRTEKAFNELPDFNIVFTSINTAEDAERTETRLTKLEVAKNIIETLSNLGINLSEGNYTETRNQIIKEYIGSRYLEVIRKDEETQPVGPTNPDNSNGKSENPSSGMSDFNGDFGGGSDFTSDNLSNEDNEDINDDIENTSDDNVETPDNIDNTDGTNNVVPPDDISRNLG